MENHFKLKEIKIIIGIGNPGGKYENTYHNVGHEFIDFIKDSSVEIRAVKSDCFMNKSGICVKNILNKNGIQPEETLIVQDDSDISLGDFKLSFDRGSAGHNGIKSIIEELGTKGFWRLRIGVRSEEDEYRVKAKKFVLNKITKEESKTLESTFNEILEKFSTEI